EYLIDVISFRCSMRPERWTLRCGVIANHGIPNAGNSLGSYLYALRNSPLPVPSPLAEAQRLYFQNQIVDVRNTYMHQAGTAPLNDNELAILVADMETCLTDVFNL